MRILVTGAAGFIGSHLAERLASEGHEVVGLDCFTDYYGRDIKEHNAESVRGAGGRFLELDLVEHDLAEAVADTDFVYHLAAQPGISPDTSFETYLRNNLVATQRLLEACLAGPSRPFFVNIATSSVYGHYATEPETAPPRPVSDYGVTKLAAEALALSYDAGRDLPACSLRIFSVYGPRDRPEKLFPRLISAVLENREFPLYEGAGEHRRSFTYIADALDAFLAVLDNPTLCRGEVFNVGSEEETRTLDAIRLVEEITGAPARSREVSKRPGDQIRTATNIGKIRERLGYTPSTDLKSGLQQTVAWSKAQRASSATR
ncbi:MAG: NAD-dependent epimerase/dehydratase family protein [Myxococcota bacterium]